ncbi:hypothetical protein E2C01_025268 [Portunus trituberculatus]|uniref:Uncharacterized protein n=1 Tax=Portunus trituberculatus TaxID=210409 RepID=A0A5B7EF50_PORTR|nr:hypothetical protein [Portunus trituberculatus]
MARGRTRTRRAYNKHSPGPLYGAGLARSSLPLLESGAVPGRTLAAVLTKKCHEDVLWDGAERSALQSVNMQHIPPCHSPAIALCRPLCGAGLVRGRRGAACRVGACKNSSWHN